MQDAACSINMAWYSRRSCPGGSVALDLAENRQSLPLPAETHTFQSGPDEPAYRLHLRLLKDGSGILVVNAATVLHLNPTAAEFAFHMIKGTSPEETPGRSPSATASARRKR